MPPPKKPVDPFADIAEPASGSDPFADIAEPSAPAGSEFAATPENKEGTYQMQTPEGLLVSVPYSKVMNASQSGYKISPDDRLRFGKDKVYALQGKQFNPDTDLPQAFQEVGASSKQPWYKPNVPGIERKVLDALPSIGGIAGGLGAGGAGLETGPADIAVATAGATAGGGLGETVKQTAEEKLFPFDHKRTAKETAKDIGVQAGLQGLSELTGRGTTKLLSPVAKFFGKTAMESKAAGIPLLPSEVRGEEPSFGEKLAKGHVFSSGVMKRFRTLQNAKTQEAVQKVADGIGKFKGTPEDLGKLVLSGIEDHEKQFHAAQNTMYDAIAKRAGEHTVRDPIYGQVSTGIIDPATKQPIFRTAITGYRDKQVDNIMPSRTKIVAFAKKALDDLEAGQEAGGKPAIPGSYEKTLREIIDNKSPDATYRGMQKARSGWLSLARDHNSGLTDEEGGLIKKMAGLADEAIDDSMQKSKLPGVLDEWREANKFTAEEKTKFEQDLVKKIVETKKPEAIATLLRGRATDATVGTGLQETRDIMEVIPKDMHAPIQRQMLLDTMRQSTNRQSKLFNERKFAERIGNIGDERGEIIFGKNWKNIKELTELLEKINGPVGLGSGSGAALQNMGALRGIVEASYLTPLALVAGGHLPSGATTAAGSFVFMQGLSRALTNPATTAKLIKALQVASRVAPYLATGAINESDGAEKNLGRVKEAAQKLQTKPAPQPAAPVPQVQFAPDGSVIHSEETGPQSSAKPVWTHVFNPDTGEIEAA